MALVESRFQKGRGTDFKCQRVFVFLHVSRLRSIRVIPRFRISLSLDPYNSLAFARSL